MKTYLGFASLTPIIWDFVGLNWALNDLDSRVFLEYDKERWGFRLEDWEGGDGGGNLQKASLLNVTLGSVWSN